LCRCRSFLLPDRDSEDDADDDKEDEDDERDRDRGMRGAGVDCDVVCSKVTMIRTATSDLWFGKELGIWGMKWEVDSTEMEEEEEKEGGVARGGDARDTKGIQQ
jgi:hypothetical protein